MTLRSPVQPNKKFTLVAAFASPPKQDLLNLEADRNAIQAALNDPGVVGQVTPVWVEKCTRTKLMEALKSPADLLHFSGHGEFEDNQGKLVLEDPTSEYGDLYPAYLLADLAKPAGVRLAVLSGCKTGEISKANPWGGVARALVLAGVPAVVASQFELYDKSAEPIAKAIYRGVLSGGTIDHAVFQARQAIYQQFELSNTDWGSLVLYLRAEDGVLFKPSVAATATSAAKAQPALSALPTGFLPQKDVLGLNAALKKWANSILTADNRRQFLVNAGVDDSFVNKLRLDSDPNKLAMSILAGFKEYQVTTKNPTYHPMLTMLSFILMQDVSDFGWGDNEETFASQLVDHGNKLLGINE